jgi:hypothetical protein
MTWSLCMFSGWWLPCLFSLQLLKDGSGTSKDWYVVHQNRSRNIVLFLTSCTWKWRKRENINHGIMELYCTFHLWLVPAVFYRSVPKWPLQPGHVRAYIHSKFWPQANFYFLPSWLGRWWVGTNCCKTRSKDHKDNMEGDPEEYWGLVDKDTKQQEELHS